MKTRNGFVSNSSSCSYVVDLGREVNSTDDLKEILNKDFWKDVKRFNKYFDEKVHTDLKNWMTFDRICELIYKLIHIENPHRNGKWILEDFLDYTPDSIPTYPQFRASYLRKKKHSHEKEFLDSEYIDDYMYAEERIWEEFNRLYRNVRNKMRIQDILENPVNLAFFSFGNESEYFGYGDEGEKEPRDDWSDEEIHMIYELRNDDLARILFKGLNWARKDYS